MNVLYYHVDAFASQVFRGNSAGVCLLPQWPSDDQLLDMAREHHLAETVFISSFDGSIHVRWFTPELEMDLCGHATLAAGHVLMSEPSALSWLRERVKTDATEVCLNSRSGALTVHKMGEGKYRLDFPERPAASILNWRANEEICYAVKSLGAEPHEVWRARDLVCVYNDPLRVISMTPDPQIMSQINLGTGGVIITALGSGSGIIDQEGREPDFISRFFTPQAELFEDDVTGSAHCTLAPFWGKYLERNTLTAYQASPRGGWLGLRLHDRDDLSGPKANRVWINGSAVTYLEGRIRLRTDI